MLRFIYSRVITGIQWIVRWSMLLYLEGTVIPLKVIMGIHWMVRWWVLVEFGHLLYHTESEWASSGWARVNQQPPMHQLAILSTGWLRFFIRHQMGFITVHFSLLLITVLFSFSFALQLFSPWT